MWPMSATSSSSTPFPRRVPEPDFKEKLYAAIATAENGKAAFSYTDESLIVAEEPEEEPDTEEPSSGINTEDPNAPTVRPTSATG